MWKFFADGILRLTRSILVSGIGTQRFRLILLLLLARERSGLWKLTCVTNCWWTFSSTSFHQFAAVEKKADSTKKTSEPAVWSSRARMYSLMQSITFVYFLVPWNIQENDAQNLSPRYWFLILPSNHRLKLFLSPISMDPGHRFY